jgi:hypothetical protein
MKRLLACLKNRSVEVAYADLGGRYPSVKTSSDAKGNWSIPFAADKDAPGSSAVVTVAQKKAGGVTCLGTSKHVQF